MGMKDLKNRSRLTTTIDTNLHDEVKKLSKQTDIPLSKLIDRAIRLLLEETSNKKEND